jgi:hypothetical protein
MLDFIVALTTNSTKRPFFKNMTQANQYHTKIDKLIKE